MFAAQQDSSYILTTVSVSRSPSGIQFVIRGAHAEIKQGDAFETFP